MWMPRAIPETGATAWDRPAAISASDRFPRGAGDRGAEGRDRQAAQPVSDAPAATPASDSPAAAASDGLAAAASDRPAASASGALPEEEDRGAAEVQVAPSNVCFTEPSGAATVTGTLHRVPKNPVTLGESAASAVKGALQCIPEDAVAADAPETPKSFTEPSGVVTVTGTLQRVPKFPVTPGESAAVTVMGTLQRVPKFPVAADAPKTPKSGLRGRASISIQPFAPSHFSMQPWPPENCALDVARGESAARGC